jgi:Protein of unknown function (DUF3737).
MENHERMIVENKVFDEERALYNLKNADVRNCKFEGPADGESTLKEARDIHVVGCDFSLRYPLWHVEKFTMEYSNIQNESRAAIWYTNNGTISNSTILGVKCLRECSNISMENTTAVSTEFGWKCSDLHISDSTIESEYLFLDSKNIKINNFQMKGKYSFQYVENLEIKYSNLDTKDAFWHSKNIVVKNSTISGAYLGWFSEGLTLINCKIIGTQPLCYCKDLKLINCTMEEADLSFEYSDVEATILGHVDSIKNPKSGTIFVDSVGEVINEDSTMPCSGKVVVNEVQAG